VTPLPVRKARRQGSLVADFPVEQAVQRGVPTAVAWLELAPHETVRIAT
jgi:hypothetical protein